MKEERMRRVPITLVALLAVAALAAAPAAADPRGEHRGITVRPGSVQPGATITIKGRGCASGTVTVRIKHTGASSTFDPGDRRWTTTLTVPGDVERGKRYRVTATCAGDGPRRIGSAHIKIKTNPYPPPPKEDRVTTSRTAVPAGQTLRIAGAGCPDVAPVAKLDDQPIALTLDRTTKGDGFTAIARIPRNTVPGRHRLAAGCDADSTRTTDLNVLDPAGTDTAAARTAFGPRPLSDLALWAGLAASAPPPQPGSSPSGRRGAVSGRGRSPPCRPRPAPTRTAPHSGGQPADTACGSPGGCRRWRRDWLAAGRLATLEPWQVGPAGPGRRRCRRR
jgi:hypothetical protein